MYSRGQSPREYIKLYEGYNPYTLRSPDLYSGKAYNCHNDDQLACYSLYCSRVLFLATAGVTSYPGRNGYKAMADIVTLSLLEKLQPSAGTRKRTKFPLEMKDWNSDNSDFQPLTRTKRKCDGERPKRFAEPTILKPCRGC